MKFDVRLSEFSPGNPVRIGNVYPIKGGYGTKAKHMMVLFAITPDNTCLLMVLNKDGVVIGVTQYAMHVFENDRMPIGFVHGLSDLAFDVVPL